MCVYVWGIEFNDACSGATASLHMDQQHIISLSRSHTHIPSLRSSIYIHHTSTSNQSYARSIIIINIPDPVQPPNNNSSNKSKISSALSTLPSPRLPLLPRRMDTTNDRQHPPRAPPHAPPNKPKPMMRPTGPPGPWTNCESLLSKKEGLSLNCKGLPLRPMPGGGLASLMSCFIPGINNAFGVCCKWGGIWDWR